MTTQYDYGSSTRHPRRRVSDKKKKRSQRKKHNRRWAPRVLLSPSQFSETKLNLKANWTWKQTEKVTWLRSPAGVLFYSSQFSSNFSKFLQPIFWVQTEKNPTIANRCPLFSLLPPKPSTLSWPLSHCFSPILLSRLFPSNFLHESRSPTEHWEREWVKLSYLTSMKIIMKKLTIAKNVPRSLQGKDTKEMPPLGKLLPR